MSADNGIYIAKFSDGYRVTEAQAIENLDYFPEGSKERKHELLCYFGESEVYKTEDEAYKKAYEIEDKNDERGDWTEYGICFVGEYESFE
jgi:hypothetical protein